MADGLTKRMKKGGRRSVAKVMGYLSPRERLLQSVRAALAKVTPNPEDCGVYRIGRSHPGRSRRAD